MTCKDCIHFEACKGMLEAQGYRVSDDHVYGENRICETYQNKDSLVPRTEIERIFWEIEGWLKEQITETSDTVYQIVDPDAMDGVYEEIRTLEWVLGAVTELKKKYGVI